MNWELYFRYLQTEDQYYRLRASGFFFEFFPEGYQTWEEHLKALEEYEQRQN